MHFCFSRCFRRVGLGVLACITAKVLAAAGPEGPRRITSVVRADLRTGKLVRSVIVTPRPVARPAINRQAVKEAVVEPRVVSNVAVAVPAPGPAPTGIDEAVDRIAFQQQVPSQLIHSVIKVESNYNTYAVSSKGAQGLMQLIPSTARRFGVSNAFNPVENIQGGAKYLKYLLDLYAGNTPLALAAYNAGEGAVARYGGVPPYAETQNYLVLVHKRLEENRKAAAARQTAAKQKSPEVKVAAEEPAGPAHIVEVVQPDGTVRYVAN